MNFPSKRDATIILKEWRKTLIKFENISIKNKLMRRANDDDRIPEIGVTLRIRLPDDFKIINKELK